MALGGGFEHKKRVQRGVVEGDGYVLRAIDQAGRPIVANALGIAIALTALWLSQLKAYAQVSMVMWVAMITAALAALLVIPALPRSGVGSSQELEVVLGHIPFVIGALDVYAAGSAP